MDIYVNKLNFNKKNGYKFYKKIYLFYDRNNNDQACSVLYCHVRQLLFTPLLIT